MAWEDAWADYTGPAAESTDIKYRPLSTYPDRGTTGVLNMLQELATTPKFATYEPSVRPAPVSTPDVLPMQGEYDRLKQQQRLAGIAVPLAGLAAMLGSGGREQKFDWMQPLVAQQLSREQQLSQLASKAEEEAQTGKARETYQGALKNLPPEYSQWTGLLGSVPPEKGIDFLIDLARRQQQQPKITTLPITPQEMEYGTRIGIDPSLVADADNYRTILREYATRIDKKPEKTEEEKLDYIMKSTEVREAAKEKARRSEEESKIEAQRVKNVAEMKPTIVQYLKSAQKVTPKGYIAGYGQAALGQVGKAFGISTEVTTLNQQGSALLSKARTLLGEKGALSNYDTQRIAKMKMSPVDTKREREVKMNFWAGAIDPTRKVESILDEFDAPVKKFEIARQCLKDPESTPEEKAQAAKILGVQF